MQAVSMQAAAFDVRRDGDTLVFLGALARDVVAAAWTRALAQVAGARRFDLTGVASVDSAGLAMLSELAARAGGSVVVSGTPRGLAELRAAYRLDEALSYSAA